MQSGARSGTVTGTPLSPASMARTGQTVSQMPHPVQRSMSILMVAMVVLALEITLMMGGARR
jgi:hypothetical protein